MYLDSYVYPNANYGYEVILRVLFTKKQRRLVL